MKVDKILEKMESLTFDVREITALKKSLADDAYNKASIVSLLNMCLNAKDLISKLASIEKSIKVRENELKNIDEEIRRSGENAKNEMKSQQGQLKEARESMNEKIKGWLDAASKRRTEIDEDVTKYEIEAGRKKKELNREIKSREYKLQDVNTKIDEAENRKKELQESLK